MIVLLGALALSVTCGGVRREESGEGRWIAGTVEAEPSLVEKWTGEEQLHVVAQSPEGETVALQAIQTLRFPADFCIRETNRITATGPIPETVRLSAYLTLDNVVVADGASTESVAWGREQVPIRLSARETLSEIREDSAEGGGEIRGTVRLSPKIEYVEQEKDILYIIVRDAEGKTLSVSRPYRNPSFPMEFVLSGGQTMMGTIPEGRDVFLVARLDRDGNALASPGDLESAVTRGPVRRGETDVQIILDRAIETQ